jgi:hypothetical protein
MKLLIRYWYVADFKKIIPFKRRRLKVLVMLLKGSPKLIATEHGGSIITRRISFYNRFVF